MSLFIFIPLFLFSIFLVFYVPGRVVLGGQKKFSNLGIFAVSIILGIVLWGWQAYLFGFLNFRFLSYFYLLFFLAVFLKRKYYSFKVPKINFKKVDLIILLIAVIGIFGQVMPFVKTGLISSNGLFVSSYNYCDHIWHAGLAQELKMNFPPNEPGLFGISLLNYNFWFHLVTGEISRVFFLPLMSVQFAGLYPMASILLAMIGYAFAVSLYNSKLFIRLFMFSLFFSGDAIGWLFSLLNGKLMLNMSQGLDDAMKFMDTPGYGFSVLIVFAAFYILQKSRQSFSIRVILLIGLLIGSLIGFKIYMGFGFLMGFGVLAVFGFFRRKFSYIWIIIVAGILSAFQFLPFNVKSGGLFFLPFETPRGFIAQEGLGLGWMDQRWSIFWEHNNYLRLAEYGVYMTLIYLFAQFGVKLLGFIPLKRTLKVLGVDFSILLYSILFSSLFVSMFFYQKVGGGNIWQFLLPVSLVLTIFASLNLSVLISKINKSLSIILIALIVIFTIPSWINFIGYFLKVDYFSGFHGISSSELKAYDYIKQNSSKSSALLLIDQPSYSNCAALSIAKTLIQRNLYFSGAGVSGVDFPDYNKRNRESAFVKSSQDNKKTYELLKNNYINYVVIYNNTPVATNTPLLKNKFVEKSFVNSAVAIFKVK